MPLPDSTIAPIGIEPGSGRTPEGINREVSLRLAVKAAIRPASADGSLEGYANRSRTADSSTAPARSLPIHRQPMAR